MGATCSSVSTFLRRLRFLRGNRLNKSVSTYPLILLLSISMLLKLLRFYSTLMSSKAPSLSISLFDSCNSSKEWHFAMNWQINLQPVDVILLFERLKTWRLYLFLFDNALMTMATPSSPILFPDRISSLIVLLRPKQSSNALIPWSPISFFFKLNISRYFLSLRA